ncbi:MAG: hypothetical protein FWB88_08370 [Defluviitaleaceae bacterium]|nr:hypothetical protein [Defluviitaleaceae bacterium]MCL2239469.1 hypothetical protein [Defluviitaleaceae bacterium]
MKRHTAAVLLVFACLLVPCLTVRAAGGMYVDETQGKIKQIKGTHVRVVGEALTGDAHADVWVCVENAPVYDLVTGLRVPAPAIKRGMGARAAYLIGDGAGVYPAVVLWLNSCRDDAAVFTAVASENIQYGADFCVFLTADGKYRITLTADSYIYDPEYGAMGPGDILPGQEFFIWVDSITASCPALVFPDKAVLVRY